MPGHGVEIPVAVQQEMAVADAERAGERVYDFRGAIPFARKSRTYAASVALAMLGMWV